MNKKTSIIIIIIIFIIIVAITLSLSSGSNENNIEEVGIVDYDSSYYVDTNGNMFIKIANICDDCCYYVVDIVFNGIEQVFSSLLGN